MQWLLVWITRNGLAGAIRTVTAADWMWSDSGIMAGSTNCSIDHTAYISTLAVGHLRFHRFTPTVSLGAHEDIERVARQEYCAQRGIEIVRRATGGGALYLDETQLCWSLLIPPVPGLAAGTSLASILEKLCGALASTLRNMGVDAVFRAPNDVEAGGRKIACGFLAADGQRMLFQGSLLLDVDIETMLKALRVPTEKLSAEGMRSARARLTTVHEQLGRIPLLKTIESCFAQKLGATLGVHIAPAPPASSPVTISSDVPAAVPEWVDFSGALRAFYRTPGGVLHAAVVLGCDRTVIDKVHISGSVQLRPSDLFQQIESGLAGQKVEQLTSRFAQLFNRTAWEIVSATEEDLRYVVQLAINRRNEQTQLGVGTTAANTLMVHSPRHDQGIADILPKATVMLVPYCAKPCWCKWRNRDGCSECGLCEVGDAYCVARKQGMRAISISNYEHLRETLNHLRDEKVAAYVGMCCENFYLKRRAAFDEAGIPAVLMDISGSNCYELGEEDRAYSGTFQAKSQLNMDLLRRVMASIPLPKVRKN
ncbi:MAG: lipoate--protein ligase family protein [Acidiferrobacterales bacterium]